MAGNFRARGIREWSVLALCEMTDADFVAVVRVADELRRRAVGDQVIDSLDARYVPEIQSLEFDVIVHATVMRTVEDKELLARRVVQFFKAQGAGASA